MRKPSWQTRNGVSIASAARRAMALRSAASWALRANTIPQPVSATPITSSWPAWMLRAWLVRARAPTWNTTGRRLPLMTYRTSFIRMRPWPAVKLTVRPPVSATPSAADALECSLSGSMNRSWVPHRFGRPSATAAWKHGRHGRARGDRVGAGDLADPRLDVGDGLGSVDDRGDARVGRRGADVAVGPGRSGKGRCSHARSVASASDRRMGRCSRSRGPFGPRRKAAGWDQATAPGRRARRRARGGIVRGSRSGAVRRGRVRGSCARRHGRERGERDGRRASPPAPITSG